MDFEQILQDVVNWLSTEGVKIVIGLIVLFIFFKVINFISRKITRSLDKRNVDKTISNAAVNVSRKALKILAFVCFLGYVGVETSSIAAAVASAGLAVGLALQGSLANFAGGVVILLMHPYKIGDYVEISGKEGTVEDVELFYTYVRTNDFKVIIVPNSQASSNVIVNYSKKELRRMDLAFYISYEADFEKAADLILQCAKETGYMLDDPAPAARMTNNTGTTVEITARIWCKNEDYWDLHLDMREKVKKAFDANGIQVPRTPVSISQEK